MKTTWVFTLFIAACLVAFTTATPAFGDIIDQDFAITARMSTYSHKELRSPTIESGRQWEGAVMFAQSKSSCPCYSFDKLMSTKWDRCREKRGEGWPNQLRRVVGNPPNHEIWTIRLERIGPSCECQSTPSGLCTGKGKRDSEIYHSEMSNSEWTACVDILQQVVEEQELDCD